jgi:hypothetical protein
MLSCLTHAPRRTRRILAKTARLKGPALLLAVSELEIDFCMHCMTETMQGGPQERMGHAQ